MILKENALLFSQVLWEVLWSFGDIGDKTYGDFPEDSESKDL